MCEMKFLSYQDRCWNGIYFSMNLHYRAQNSSWDKMLVLLSGQVNKIFRFLRLRRWDSVKEFTGFLVRFRMAILTNLRNLFISRIGLSCGYFHGITSQKLQYLVWLHTSCWAEVLWKIKSHSWAAEACSWNC